MNTDKSDRWHFRLFVAGDSPQSRKAVNDLDNIVERCEDGADVTVVDLFTDPEMASERDILAIPTLIRETPLPPFRIIGDLSNEDRIWSMLSA